LAHLEDHMRHPLDSLPPAARRPLLLVSLAVTLLLFGIFRLLDAPLRTSAAPNGIVSFELAGTEFQARAILDSWNRLSLLLSSVPGIPNSEVLPIPFVFAAFGLGLDYLFMPLYALALSLAILLAAGRHGGVFKQAGAWLGWGAFAAAAFDALENFALFRVLTGMSVSPWPRLAAVCAILKFTLLLVSILFALTGWLLPRRS
jgi:hypothetical protein